MPAYIEMTSPTIEHTQFMVAGWIASQQDSEPVSVTINGLIVAHARHERPDVRSALAQFSFTSGISASVDLLTFPAADHIEISLTFGQE